MAQSIVGNGVTFRLLMDHDLSLIFLAGKSFPVGLILSSVDRGELRQFFVLVFRFLS